SSSSNSLDIVIVLTPLKKHGPKRSYTEDRTLSPLPARPQNPPKSAGFFCLPVMTIFWPNIANILGHVASTTRV
ncbi:hypothetical protein, partial [Roseovarius sp. MBR-6]|uniref:hypothetical protein n=1 Tax=Roseovarius sp. MBR-6 TaxID=3156459 RepID=UPI003394258C